ncbi:MAG: PmoA family protein, partial [Verrucomicrobiae bacterium]|nr:PmoA family protein [Verrucomicrobiae bacterium]
NGNQKNAGRVFRISGKDSLSVPTQQGWNDDLTGLNLDELVAALDSPLDARRVAAQEELVRRDRVDQLLHRLKAGTGLSERQRTWLAWTVARSGSSPDAVNGFFVGELDATHRLEDRLTAIRILAFRDALPSEFGTLFADEEPRVRFAAAVAMREARTPLWVKEIIGAAATESDRLAFYAQWNALRDLLPEAERRVLLENDRPGVRLAALLGMLEDGLLGEGDVRPHTGDADSRVARLAEEWLEKAGLGAEPLLTMSPESGSVFEGESVDVTLATSVEGGTIHYTLDGNPPVENSPKFRGPIAVREGQTLRAVVLRERVQVGRTFEGTWTRDRTKPYEPRPFLSGIEARSGHAYSMDWVGLRAGAAIYADRDYRVREVPGPLKGLPFLRTANADDASSGAEWLRFSSDEPLSVLVALDTRLPEPPFWMKVGEEDGFQPTKYTLGAEDPKSFSVFRKSFPAGEIVLGGNTNDGKGGGKGSYLVAFDRGNLLRPPTEPVTIETVLAQMPDGDPARGRDLFLHAKGAGCYLCHRMDGRGNVFAPDLSDIGSRADARTIIESILEPSATITEGFGLQVFTMKNGTVLSGIVLEESGQRVKLGMMGGIEQVLAVAEIAKRDSPHLSAMPAGYGAAMNATQVANVVAWLREQKRGFSFRKGESSLDLQLDGKHIATYLLDHEKLTRRAFVNVRTPSGFPVTRNFPPRKPEDLDPGYQGEDGIIHPVMHAGLWMSFGWIDGNDYWRLLSPVKFEKYLEEPEAEGNEARFATRDRYLDQDGKTTICLQDTRYRFRRIDEGIVLDWDATFFNDERDFAFGDQEESGLALRIASPLRVQGGNGEIVNDRGEVNGLGTWGKEFEWIDYSGVIDGKHVGVMIMPHPDNRRACWSHSRDYGALVANPFPRQPKERREPYVTTMVKKGERFRLRYRVLVHEGDAAVFDPGALASRLEGER